MALAVVEGVEAFGLVVHGLESFVKLVALGSAAVKAGGAVVKAGKATYQFGTKVEKAIEGEVMDLIGEKILHVGGRQMNVNHPTYENRDKIKTDVHQSVFRNRHTHFNHIEAPGMNQNPLFNSSLHYVDEANQKNNPFNQGMIHALPPHADYLRYGYSTTSDESPSLGQSSSLPLVHSSQF